MISSPSSTHATPSAITSRVWKRAQGSRSIRAGTRLLTTPEGVSLIVLLPGGRPRASTPYYGDVPSVPRARRLTPNRAALQADGADRRRSARAPPARSFLGHRAAGPSEQGGRGASNPPVPRRRARGRLQAGRSAALPRLGAAALAGRGASAAPVAKAPRRCPPTRRAVRRGRRAGPAAPSQATRSSRFGTSRGSTSSGPSLGSLRSRRSRPSRTSLRVMRTP